MDAARINEASLETITLAGQEMTAVTLPGYRQELPENRKLYMDYAPAKESPVCLRLIPYYAWANRGAGEMTVWMRV